MISIQYSEAMQELTNVEPSELVDHRGKPSSECSLRFVGVNHAINGESPESDKADKGNRWVKHDRVLKTWNSELEGTHWVLIFVDTLFHVIGFFSRLGIFCLLDKHLDLLARGIFRWIHDDFNRLLDGLITDYLTEAFVD